MHKNFPKTFVFLDKYNNKIFNNNNTKVGIIYRNYNDINREKELSRIAKACKKKRFLLFVSNNIRLAIKFKADGIYIPSFIKNKKYINLEKKNLIVLGSAHNQKEIFQKISQRCDGIFLSPIFPVNKKNTFLNLHKFNFLANSNNINFYALGGINEDNINKLKLLSIKGFGGITIFKKKPAYKRPVFKNLIS